MDPLDLKNFRDAITRSAMGAVHTIGGLGYGGGGAGGSATIIGSGVAIGGAGGAGGQSSDIWDIAGSDGGFAGAGTYIYNGQGAGAVGADKSFETKNEWHKEYSIVGEMNNLKVKCNMALISINSSMGSTFYSKLLYRKLYIAGGCFTSWLHGEKPNDIDIFVIDSDDELMAAFVEIKGVWEDSRYNLGEINANVRGVYSRLDDEGNKYQIIFTRYKSREELIRDFDFVHTMVSYDTKEDKLYLTKQTYDAIVAKNLIRNKRCSVKPHDWRVDKFKERGWYVSDASV